MGTYYSGGSPTYNNLTDNLIDTTKSYPLDNGYFGKIGKSKNPSISQIDCADPVKEARKFFDKISYGGIETKYDDGKIRVDLKDGTTIMYREITSTKGSPAVDINVKKVTKTGSVKSQKIHFEKENEDEHNK